MKKNLPLLFLLLLSSFAHSSPILLDREVYFIRLNGETGKSHRTIQIERNQSSPSEIHFEMEVKYWERFCSYTESDDKFIGYGSCNSNRCSIWHNDCWEDEDGDCWATDTQCAQYSEREESLLVKEKVSFSNARVLNPKEKEFYNLIFTGAASSPSVTVEGSVVDSPSEYITRKENDGLSFVEVF